MPDAHAKFSPSSLYRVRLCPASYRMAQDAPPEITSQAAIRGSAMHLYMELLLDGEDPDPDCYPGYTLTDADIDHCETAHDWILSQQFERILTEQRLPVGQAVGINDPDLMWGTSDVIAVKDNTLFIIDYKFGHNEVNPGGDQDLAYLVGAIHNMGEFDNYETVIFQNGRAKSLNIPQEAIDTFKEQTRSVVSTALTNDAPFNPGEKQCMFCPANGICRQFAEWTVMRDFGKPDELTAEEIADILDRAKSIKTFLAAVEERALLMAEFGEDIPGYHVVQKAGRARYIDDTDVVSAIIDAGLDIDKFAPRKPVAQSTLKKHLEIDGLIEKPEGKKTLVRSSE